MVIWHRFKPTLLEAFKVPRSQLDKCSFILKACLEFQKSRDVDLDKLDRFVDLAFTYVSDIAAEGKKADWETVKGALLEVSGDGEMARKLEAVEMSDRNMGELEEKLKVRNEMGKGLGWITTSLFFVRGDKSLQRREYEVKRCTPPHGLTAIVTMSLKKHEGSAPTFYEPFGPKVSGDRAPYKPPETQEPHDWGKLRTPKELNVVVNRSVLRFNMQIPPFTKTQLFRNVVIFPRGQIFLKDSRGILHSAPNAELTRPVQCKQIKRRDLDQTEISDRRFDKWGEILAELLEANGDEWIIGWKNEAQPLRSLSLAEGAPAASNPPVSTPPDPISTSTSDSNLFTSAILTPPLPIAPSPPSPPMCNTNSFGVPSRRERISHLPQTTPESNQSSNIGPNSPPMPPFTSIASPTSRSNPKRSNKGNAVDNPPPEPSKPKKGSRFFGSKTTYDEQRARAPATSRAQYAWGADSVETSSHHNGVFRRVIDSVKESVKAIIGKP